MDDASVASYNALRIEVKEGKPITAYQIELQMAHRLTALAIFAGVCYCAVASFRLLGARHPLAKGSLLWAGLITLQIILGAVTIWTNKAADIATAHVVVGALSLATGALLTIVSFKVLIPARVPVSPVAAPAKTPVLTGAGKPAATNAK
jgi:cytochrome c oxidase assembly protein subunit 15